MLKSIVNQIQYITVIIPFTNIIVILKNLINILLNQSIPSCQYF